MSNTGFLLKRPDLKRRTFQIIPYQRTNGKRVYSTPLAIDELKALNNSVKDGTLSVVDAEVQIKKLILPKLRKAANGSTDAIVRGIISEHNLNVFTAFWAKEYRRKKLERPSIAKDEFLAALRILEPLSLHSTDVDELQAHWDKKESGTRHKRYGNRINALLRFLKRDDVQIETDVRFHVTDPANFSNRSHRSVSDVRFN